MYVLILIYSEYKYFQLFFPIYIRLIIFQSYEKQNVRELVSKNYIRCCLGNMTRLRHAVCNTGEITYEHV